MSCNRTDDALFPTVHMAIGFLIPLFLASLFFLWTWMGNSYQRYGALHLLMNMIPFPVFLIILLLLGSVQWLCHVATCEARTLEITCIYTLSPITHSTGQNVQLPM